ncbi:hypothetical protein AYO47_02610 [Planctomyces sp. SCGC AG-212-M04]|nr:hypothetical protein AYO47_02610 [Planctomyces sp. SCGC AG-212-M04]
MRRIERRRLSDSAVDKVLTVRRAQSDLISFDFIDQQEPGSGVELLPGDLQPDPGGHLDDQLFGLRLPS